MRLQTKIIDRMNRNLHAGTQSRCRPDGCLHKHSSKETDRFELVKDGSIGHYSHQRSPVLSFKFLGMLPVMLAALLFCAPSHARSARAADAAADALAESAQGVSAELPADTGGEENAVASGDWKGETGIASFYGRAFQGRRTAGGGRFNQMALTAAHPWLPLGTKVLVTVEETGRAVVVTITDRLPSGRRVIDVSLAAARVLGFVGQGLAEVSLVQHSFSAR